MACSQEEEHASARLPERLQPMSSHCFSEIFLHLNWHCLSDRPLIVPAVEPVLHKFLKHYCMETPGVFHHGSGGTADHVHMLIRIEPNVLISDFVGKLKGASSFEINKAFGKSSLNWQRGYGVVSFAKRNLPGLAEYVAHQKEHHAGGTVRPTLEIHDAVDEEEDLRGVQARRAEGRALAG
jgi:REP element-mobilizing transposase RayT